MSKNKAITLHEPIFKGNELKYLKKCLDSTWVSTSGYFIDKFENEVKKYTKSKYAIFCVNGTSGLHISLLVAGVGYGDEVIVPTITFIAPVNAIKYNGADPIFMDCDNFYNIDQYKTIEFLNSNTDFKNGYTVNKKTKKIIKAIIIVHAFGNAADFGKLNSLCKKRNIKLIEDASESLGSFYNKNNKHTGTIGDLGVISFNGNKIITAGAGGMILTNNNILNKKIRYLIKQAKDDTLNFIHNNIGYNYAQTNINAAIGLAQFESIAKILTLKKNIYEKYKINFDKFLNHNLVLTPNYSNNNHWLNVIRINRKNKDYLIKKLISKNIYVRPIWYPNHLQKMYKNNQSYKITNATKLYDESVCLPSSYHLSDSDFIRVVKTIFENDNQLSVK